MTERDDNVYYIEDYRQQVQSGDGGNGTDITITLKGKAAEVVTLDALQAKVSEGEIVARHIGLGAEHNKLKSEGWTGPIYEKSNPRPGRLGKLLGKIGVKQVSRLKLTR